MKTTISIVLGLTCFFVAGCTRGPSDNDVSTIVTEIAKSKGYEGLTGVSSFTGPCGLGAGEISAVESVNVTTRSEKNAEGGYWPVKVTISGTCMIARNTNCEPYHNTLCPGAPGPFTSPELAFAFTKGDFDKWSAEKLADGK